MQLEFPYQIVTFLNKEPTINEPVYYGEHGWYLQVALKRRFKLNGISEEDFVKDLRDFFHEADVAPITTGDLVKPETMPVRVIHITSQATVKNLHHEILAQFGDKIISRYPDREGDNYYPHITAEYNDQFVIPVDEYTYKTFAVRNVWLLKDVGDENSLAYAKIR